ncbi:CST complex subunit STN1 [Forsythia ovata]|uniref:CST complex subunit STN1 n=1 Tax=Forsythia ovata TaxID=205694 RepID=A0ABD1VEA1_9LAMI
MDILYDTHVKLLAFDFLKLTPSPMDPSSSSRNGMRLSRFETLWFVVPWWELEPNKFPKFSIDDGTDVRLIADVAVKFASEIQLGVFTKVRGRIMGNRGTLQITVSDVVIERDPNSQVLHWLD